MLSYIKINKQNVLSNINSIKGLLKPEQKIAAVIKANAYGHDQNLIAQILENEVDFFQLDDIEELRLLRKVSDKPVLMFGYVMDDELEEVVNLGGIVGVYDLPRIELLNEIGKRLSKKVPVHVKIDAFLGRQGVVESELDEFIKRLTTSKWLEIAGVYSHFSDADNLNNIAHSKRQLNSFVNACEKFKNAGFTNFNTHMTATAGVFIQRDLNTYFDIVRVGLGLYGLWPSNQLKERFEDSVNLKPVLSWHTHVAQVKTLPEGYPIGYGLKYITSRSTRIAVIPQGYSDGYDRGLTNIGEVLIHGKRAKVLGRISMNMFVVDVSDIGNVERNDEVVIIGKQNGDEITATEIADKIDTINYEITTRITPLLPRVMV